MQCTEIEKLPITKTAGIKVYMHAGMRKAPLDLIHKTNICNKDSNAQTRVKSIQILALHIYATW